MKNIVKPSSLDLCAKSSCTLSVTAHPSELGLPHCPILNSVVQREERHVLRGAHLSFGPSRSARDAVFPARSAVKISQNCPVRSILAPFVVPGACSSVLASFVVSC